MEIKNKIISKRIIFLVITIFFAIILLNKIGAQSLPLSIHGEVFDLDGNKINESVWIKINDTTSGYYAQGKSGTFYNKGKYSASVQGNNGDNVIITASNGYHDVSYVINLQGSLRNVSLYLNMSKPPKVNRPPEIISEPLREAFSGVFYTYDVNAIDADGDELTYSLIESPARMTINPTNGIIEWMPRFRDIGTKRVKVKVDDGQNGTDTQEFGIRVRLRIKNINISDYYRGLINNESLDEKSYILDLKPNENYKFGNDMILNEVKLNEINEETFLLIREFDKKPDEIKNTFRSVYRYLQLNSLNIESEIVENITLIYKIDKNWMKTQKNTKEEIGIARYSEGNWYYFVPKIIKEDENYIYYKVEINGLDYFVIFAGKFRDVKKFDNLIEMPYFVVGTIFENDGKTQSERNKEIKILNEKTGQEIIIYSGIGPMDGAYATYINGEQGERIIIKIGDNDKSSYKFTLNNQRGNEINFKKNILGNYKAKKENILNLEISNLINFLGNLFN